MITQRLMGKLLPMMIIEFIFNYSRKLQFFMENDLKLKTVKIRCDMRIKHYFAAVIPCICNSMTQSNQIISRKYEKNFPITMIMFGLLIFNEKNQYSNHCYQQKSDQCWNKISSFGKL